MTTTLRDRALTARAWPFEEARKVLKRYENKQPEKGYVLFETGYGPSGLPHIGTFGEVLRTTMVRRAFELMSDIPTKLLAFSDDMDGLRKVPTNVPNQDLLAAALNKRLTKVPTRLAPMTALVPITMPGCGISWMALVLNMNLPVRRSTIFPAGLIMP